MEKEKLEGIKFSPDGEIRLEDGTSYTFGSIEEIRGKFGIEIDTLTFKGLVYTIVTALFGGAAVTKTVNGDEDALIYLFATAWGLWKIKGSLHLQDNLRKKLVSVEAEWKNNQK